MRIRILLATVASLTLLARTQGQLTYQLDQTLVAIDVVLDSSRVNIPWEIVWGPEDRLWMTDGPLITRWDPLTDVMDTLLVRGYGNGLGLALHPDFPATPIIMAVFDTSTYYSSGHVCEVSRFTYDAIEDRIVDEDVLFTYYHGGEHAGGRLLFDTTGHVLLTTPDYYINGPDTLFSPVGKTLRSATDGSVPVDNPRADHTWTYGHRNPQGLTMLPNGAIVTSEHGMAPWGNEINLIQRNGYYGWPAYDGDQCTSLLPDSCTSPTFTYTHALATFAEPPSGTEFYTSDLIPEFHNKLITCVLWYRGLKLFSFTEAFDSITEHERLEGGAFDDLSRIRDIAIRPDGRFYLITNDRENARICLVQPDASVSVDDRIDPSGLLLWPNPVNDRLLINIANASSDMTVQLLTLEGRAIDPPTQRSGDRFFIDVRSLPAGHYVVRTSTGLGARFVRQ